MASRILSPKLNVGQRFGRLTIIEPVKRKNNQGINETVYSVQCDCGSPKKIVYKSNLVNGYTTSCGCFWRERMSNLFDSKRSVSLNVGDRIGRLTVTSVIKKPNGKTGRYQTMCIVDCECGTIGKAIPRSQLVSSRTQSCGCLQRIRAKTQNTKYPRSWKKTIQVFHSAKNRCINPRDAAYANYGGRGITFDFLSVEELIAEIGTQPFGKQLDRIDTNKGYKKGNVRWVLASENVQNMRNSHYWHIDGVRYESSGEAATALRTDTATVQRWCKGRKRNGKFYPPRENCWAERKYPDQADAAALLDRID